MEEKNVNSVNKGTMNGKLTYEDKVIQKIVGISLETIDGLLTVDGGFFSNLAGKIVNTEDTTSGIDVEVGEKQVAVDLDIVAEYGKNVADIYEKIKTMIKKEVKAMTDLDVIEVNVNVVDVKTRKQFEEDSTTLQDKVGEATSEVTDFTSEQAEKLGGLANKGKKKAKEQLEPRVE